MCKDPLVAFGFSGDEGVGLQFRNWLSSSECTDGTSWADFAHTAGTRLSELNGQRRERAKLAGLKDVEKNKALAAEVLLVGCVGGIVDAWELTDTGGVSSVSEMGFHGESGFFAIGSGWGFAFIAHQTLTRATEGKLPHGPKNMEFIMEIAARHAVMCEPPISLYRVTADEIRKLAPGPKGDWIECEAVSKEEQP